MEQTVKVTIKALCIDVVSENVAFVQMTTQMPVHGFGTFNNFTAPDAVGTAVSEALKVGYRHFDCAELYSNEKEIGDAIKASGVERDQLYLVSKVWNHHHEPEEVLTACKASMAALQVDYLDCYLIHWPVAWDSSNLDGAMLRADASVIVGEPSTVTIEETWAAMESLVERGLVKHIGISNFSVSLTERIIKVAKIKPYCNQVECHPHLQQTTLLECCNAHGIKLVAYHPLGKPSHRKEGEPVALKEPVIVQLSEKYGKTPAQVILQWNLQRGVVVIPKSTTPSRIKENFDAADGSFSLNEEEMAAVAGLDCCARFCQPAWCPTEMLADP